VWWNDIQPETHKRGEGDPLSTDVSMDDIDWRALRKTGPNRMFLVLVALTWWRAQLGPDAEGQSLFGWQESLNDVTWVLARLTETYHGTDSEAETSEPAKITKLGRKRN